MRTLLAIVLLSLSAAAQTVVDAMLTLKNVSPSTPGTQMTGTILNNGTIGTSMTWSFISGTASAITVGPHQASCNLGNSVSIGGVTYPPQTPSQSFAYDNNADFTTYRGEIPAGRTKISIGLCIVLNASPNNLYDIIGVYNLAGRYVMLQQRNTNQLNLETDGGGTLHSGAITLTIGQTYYCTFLADYTGGTAKLRCYQPTYPYTQVGTEVTVTQQTGSTLDYVRVGNNELGVANATTYLENIVFDWTNAAFPLNLGSQYAPWAGFISPVRAIDFSQAGYVGGIPTRQRCTTGTGTSVLPATSTSAQINTALSGCDANHAVELAAGTFNGLGMITIPNFKTLRGQGADQTKLNFTSASGCTGQLTLICLAGDNTDKTNRRNQTNWTAGYLPGATTITLAGPLTNLVIGKSIILDQTDDTTDLGGIVVSDTSSSMTATAPGVAGPRSLEGNGGGSQTSGRQQQQIVTVVGCNGSVTVGAACTGSNQQITISPGLYMPNWSSTRTPQAWWATTQHEGGGVENLSIDSGSDTNSAMVFKWLNSKNTYIKGVRSIAAYRAHLQMQYATHGTIQDSYFFLNQGAGPTNYGVECYGASDVLIANNIFQAVTGPIPLNSACQGIVIAYNYFTNIYYSGSAGWNNPFANNHAAGTEFDLIEGNVGNGWDADVFHGTHHFNTIFRNRFAGTQPVCYASGSSYATATYGPCNNNRIGLQLRSWARFYNVVGNVMGTSGVSNTYASTAGDRTIFTLNNGNSNGSVTVPDDPNVTTTLLRWGNWDTVNNATRFQSSEVPSSLSANSQSPFSNFQPTVGNTGQPALPASLYYTSKPAFFSATKPWPPIGPDITGGNISGTGGHAFTIPAQDCAATIGIPSDGTGSAVAFNATSCYSPSAASGLLSPSSVNFGPVTLGTSSSPQAFTFQNVGSSLLTISSISMTGGTGVGDYSQTNNCGSTLVASASCTINVTFTPLVAGSRTTTLRVVSDATNSPNDSSLSGTGLQPFSSMNGITLTGGTVH